MRVLHVITGLDVGGAERQLRELLGLLPPGQEVVTLTEPGPVAREMAADGVPVHHVPMAGNRDLRALPRLVRLIRAGGYDVVHTHLYRACLYGRIAARAAGVRAVVATEHSLGEHDLERRPLGPGVRGLYLAGERLGTVTLAVSDVVADRLVRWGVPPRRIAVVPNGVDAARLRPDPAVRRRVRAGWGVPEGTPLVAGLGRLVPGKRFGTLVRALALTAAPADADRAAPGGAPVPLLVLAGEGPERDRLRRLAADLGVADRVLLPGSLPAAELLAAADVLVSPSPAETFGLAVLEAVAAGLPVLYADCPAITELPPGAVPGARRVASRAPELARALWEITADGPPARLPVPEVLRPGGRYDPVVVARRHLDLYRALAMGARVRHAPGRAPERMPGCVSGRGGAGESNDRPAERDRPTPWERR
ncbi:glycosyltransferase [Streptomyces sp. ST2-7A]|uniref:glycosyltransferase n=1 Tax=Streptomyces sp. ST2-7A TaxID=2907214 RepID=UPI001F42D9BE|nr:glycosyltransferase [Streptomyces sp. ST2-7A]MCE7080670.1 glycosyltransferase [Streptomyces sp. ST2-7A]